MPVTRIEGIKIGHATDDIGKTGVTVILVDEPVTAGCDIRGGAPGTRETDLLDPLNTVEKIDALVLSGGSAFGLESASGVMRWLREQGRGFVVGPVKVPIVPAAVLFDLAYGSPTAFPDIDMGIRAAQAASVHFEIGSVGAGTGATVGKLDGFDKASKSGVGFATVSVSGLTVEAIVAVNAVGEVFDSATNEIMAGIKRQDGNGFQDSISFIKDCYALSCCTAGFEVGNTTIGAVITNAKLSKTQACKVAQMAHNGYALSIRPVHTPYDGDSIFCLATGKLSADTMTVAVLAVEAVRQAVLAAVSLAR